MKMNKCHRSPIMMWKVDSVRNPVECDFHQKAIPVDDYVEYNSHLRCIIHADASGKTVAIWERRNVIIGKIWIGKTITVSYLPQCRFNHSETQPQRWQYWTKGSKFTTIAIFVWGECGSLLFRRASWRRRACFSCGTKLIWWTNLLDICGGEFAADDQITAASC